MPRFILHPFGSLGDLNPYLALAIGLRGRGHEVLLATSEVYREKVMAEGIEFAGVRPDVGELLREPELIEKLWHPRTGSEFLIRKYILPQLEDSYADLVSACRGADVVLTHVAGYAGPIAAEILQIPWFSLALQPMVYFSAYDPPLIPGAGWLHPFYTRRPSGFRALMKGAEWRLKAWAEPVARLRRGLGLPAATANPLLAGQFSPYGTLALFSPHFAGAQPDWPVRTRQTGFIFYDRQGRIRGAVKNPHHLAEELDEFLSAGPPPVLFTLGSSAVTHPGTFFRESLKAAEEAGMRAVLLTGPVPSKELARCQSASVFCASYLPYSEIMPRAGIVVHQGGIGTTAQALRGGRPMLVVPWAHDQPDNAARLRRLGVARVLARQRYRAPRIARDLKRLTEDVGYRQRAAALGEKIAAEEGLKAALDAVEEMAASSRAAGG